MQSPPSITAASCLPSELPVNIRLHWRDTCLTSHSSMPREFESQGKFKTNKQKKTNPSTCSKPSTKFWNQKITKYPKASMISLTICNRHKGDLLDSEDYENRKQAAKKDTGILSWRKDYSPTLMVHVQFQWDGSLKQTLWGHVYAWNHKHLLHHFSSAFNKNPQIYGRTEWGSHRDMPSRIQNINFLSYLFYLDR